MLTLRHLWYYRFDKSRLFFISLWQWFSAFFKWRHTFCEWKNIKNIPNYEQMLNYQRTKSLKYYMAIHTVHQKKFATPRLRTTALLWRYHCCTYWYVYRGLLKKSKPVFSVRLLHVLAQTDVIVYSVNSILSPSQFLLLPQLP